MSSAAATAHAQTAQSTQLDDVRYRLPDVVLHGAPISVNRYKDKGRVDTKRGAQLVMDFYKPAARAWLQQAKTMTLDAIARRDATTPHPRDWPVPFRISVYVRDYGVDLSNSLKVPEDGIKLALERDDKFYEFGCVVREAYRTGERGMRIVIESAPLSSVQTTTSAATRTPKTTKPAINTRSRAVRRHAAETAAPSARALVAARESANSHAARRTATQRREGKTM